jgi:thioredoxin 1
MGQFTLEGNQQNFQTLVASGVTLVDFWAAWCGPCRALAPKLEEVALEVKGKAKIVKVDTDANGELAAQFGIRSIPTLILFKNGEVVDQIMGNVPKEALLDLIHKHA